jgi:hypothetical protein
MDLLKTALRANTRMKKGNVLLANAQIVNTKPVKARFDAFVETHRRYIEAQANVDEAEGLERAELKRVEQQDGMQDRAIDALSAALLLDGEPRRNPFTRFSDRGPGQIIALSFAEKVKAVHNLVTTLRRSMGLSEATLQAADKAEEAALKVEEAQSGWELRRTNLALVRQARDSLGTQWDTAYSALRNLTKSVVENRDLYATLFARPNRSAKKAKPAGTQTVVTQVKPAESPATVPEVKPAETPIAVAEVKPAEATPTAETPQTTSQAA